MYVYISFWPLIFVSCIEHTKCLFIQRLCTCVTNLYMFVVNIFSKKIAIYIFLFNVIGPSEIGSQKASHSFAAIH